MLEVSYTGDMLNHRCNHPSFCLIRRTDGYSVSRHILGAGAAPIGVGWRAVEPVPRLYMLQPDASDSTADHEQHVYSVPSIHLLHVHARSLTTCIQWAIYTPPLQLWAIVALQSSTYPIIFYVVTL